MQVQVLLPTPTLVQNHRGGFFILLQDAEPLGKFTLEKQFGELFLVNLTEICKNKFLLNSTILISNSQ